MNKMHHNLSFDRIQDTFVSTFILSQDLSSIVFTLPPLHFSDKFRISQHRDRTFSNQPIHFVFYKLKFGAHIVTHLIITTARFPWLRPEACPFQHHNQDPVLI